MVTLLKDYEQQTYFFNTADDISDIVFHNGDQVFLMDQDLLLIYDEDATNWYPVSVPGETIYYSEYDGKPYPKHFHSPTAYYEGVVVFRKCPELESYEFHNTDTEHQKSLGQYAFAHDTKLKTVIIDQRIPDMINNNREFQSDTALETVQLGGIDHPVAGMSNGNIFADCTQSGLTITIYVADNATLPFSGSPFGATNATIIYRSSTTGEVLTV